MAKILVWIKETKQDSYSRRPLLVVWRSVWDKGDAREPVPFHQEIITGDKYVGL